MLRLRNIDAFYDGIQVLRHVSLHVGKGEIVSLLGGNGAGKSTLLNVVSGLHKCQGGEVTFLEEQITNARPERIVAKGVVQVPEGREVLKSMTVLENLELGAFLRYGREGRDEIGRDLDRVFELFPVLKERRRQLAGTLSGGEQQMLAIGRGLMARPHLLMLDEPSFGLAPLIVTKIFQVIENLKRAGITILLVEQNAASALAISDRAYVMETGQIILEGRGWELLHDEEVKRAFLGKDYREKWER